jgi:NADH dehydrogenase
VLWAAGVEASPLGRVLAEAAGVAVDRLGRVPVQPDLTLPGYPDVFVLGDLAHCPGPDGQPLPGVAPVALQQGRYVAELIRARFQARLLPPFQYNDLGTMATIGRKAAIAQIGRWQFRGVIAWLLWLFIHLIQLVQFESRVLVLIQWAWNYVTFSRSTRLITGVGPLPAATPREPRGA